jgi:hypothetical protein
LLIFPLFSSLPTNHGQEQEGWKFVALLRRQAKARAKSPSEDFEDSEYSEDEFSSESEGAPVYASPPVSSDDSDDSQGIAAEVWTYIRAVERSGLEGSDESEVSSDEENSSDSSEEESGGGDGDEEGTEATTARATAARATSMARAVVAAARPVAKRHWFKY